MAGSTIGIRIADGTYYAILNAEEASRKKLVLTTVRDDQDSVHIDLYEGDGKEIADARYIGSLVIESIQPGKKGEAEIELVAGVDNRGNLSAQARDVASGESQTLRVSLEALSEDGVSEIPDFQLDEDLGPWVESLEEKEVDQQVAESGLGTGLGDDEVEEESESIEDAEDIEVTEDTEELGSAEAQVSKRRPWLLAILLVLGIAAIVMLAILLYKLFQTPTVPPLKAATGTESSAPAEYQNGGAGSTQTGTGGTAPKAASGAGAAETTQPRAGPEQRTAAPSSSGATAISEENIGGVWYWIRWGDTLWGISNSFYKTPWLYGSIAQFNSITNPNLILAGSRIYIPKK